MGTASTVVDGQDLLHVAVCHIASVVLCQPGDGLGMHCAQPENQPFPAVFSLIQSQKTSHAMQDARQKGIRIAAPRIYENTQHFMVKGCAVALVDVVSYLYFRIFVVIYARMPISYSVENDKAIPKNPTRILRYGFYYRLRFDRTNSDDGTN